MRESLTLFTAVALCLLLCLPSKSLSKIWSTSTNSLTTVVKTVATLPEILSIKFKSEKQLSSIVEPVEIHLIPQAQPNQYTLDWSSFVGAQSFIKIYNATGNLLSNIDIQNVGNQGDTLVENIKLTPGIYYAYMALNTHKSTQKGYAKFVVK